MVEQPEGVPPGPWWSSALERVAAGGGVVTGRGGGRHRRERSLAPKQFCHGQITKE